MKLRYGGAVKHAAVRGNCQPQPLASPIREGGEAGSWGLDFFVGLGGHLATGCFQVV